VEYRVDRQMVGVKKICSTVIVALVVASAVHADMMPLSPLEGGSQQSVPVRDGTISQQPSDSGQLGRFLGPIDLDSFPIGFLPAAGVDAGGTSQTESPPVLTDRQNSFSLCLYALMGLGLCHTAPWVKKLHIGLIPDWYHSGAPYQIGHSFAISPDCVSSAPIYSFIQPDSPSATQDILPQFHQRNVISLWRKSQFTPTVLASRGPPSIA
jgi:hypothetical protein